MKHIERLALQQRLASGDITLVEALPHRYYAAEHLPGALHLPHDEVEALAPQLLQDKQASIVVYCASATCQNSHIAAERLARMGYADVAVYVAGKKDWIEAGLPVESA